MLYLRLIILMVSALTSCVVDAYEIVELEPGVVLNKKGEVKAIAYEKQFIIKLNLQEIETEIKNIREEKNDIIKKCNPERYTLIYIEAFEIKMNYQLDEIKRKFEHILFSLNKRNKRNVMGAILSFITGAMTSREKIELEEKIILIREQNIKQFEKIYENTRILEKHIEKIDNLEQSIKENKNSMAEKLIEIKQKTDKVRWYGSVVFKMEFLSKQENILQNRINRIKEVLGSIEEGINDAHNNVFTSNIYNLANILEVIKGTKLEEGQKWIIDPIKPDFQILKYLTKIYTLTDNENLYFVLQIPLIEEELVAYETFDIPRLEANVAYFVETTTNYVMSDLENSKYAEVSRDQFNENCKTMAGTFYCTEINIFNLEHNNCVGSILDQKITEIGKYCKERVLRLDQSSMIIQKMDDHSVLIINPSEKAAKIIVNQNLHKVKIPKTALLKVKSKSKTKLVTDDYEIIMGNKHAENFTDVITFPEIFKTIDSEYLEDYLKINEIKEVKELNKIEIYKNSIDFEELKEALDEGKEKLEKTDFYLVFIILNIIWGIITIVVIAMIIGWKRNSSSIEKTGEAVPERNSVEEGSSSKPQATPRKQADDTASI